jgi:ABC-type Zn uptake system ZnuABC Zn-binding protein ZnuA
LRHLALPGLLAALAIVLACGGSSADQKGSVKVVATTVQITALTRQVAGDRIDLRQIIPAGADPHEFEPTAGDLAAISEADLILRHGIGLDTFLDKAIDVDSGRVVTVTDGLPLTHSSLDYPGRGIPRCAPEIKGAFGCDPHVWHDPQLDKMMVDNIRDALIEVDAAGRDEYETNAESYKRVLDETDARIRELIDAIPPENRKLVTNHDSLGYFAQRYGLTVVGAVIPSTSTQAEASAGATAALLETIYGEGVRAIFAESSVNADLARQLAGDAGVTIVDDLYGDTLGEPGSGAETVDGMLLANARLIAEALR